MIWVSEVYSEERLLKLQGKEAADIYKITAVEMQFCGRGAVLHKKINGCLVGKE